MFVEGFLNKYGLSTGIAEYISVAACFCEYRKHPQHWREGCSNISMSVALIDNACRGYVTHLGIVYRPFMILHRENNLTRITPAKELKILRYVAPVRMSQCSE